MTETLQWEADAHEFGRWQSGWRARLLVARNVEKGKGQGGTGANQYRAASANAESAKDDGNGKVGAETYAREAGTSGDTVLRALEYWDWAHSKGAPIPHSSELKPGDEVDLAGVEAWEKVYEEEKAGKEAGTPFHQFCDLVGASGKKLLATMDVTGLSKTDAHDAKRPLDDLEDTMTEVRDFLDVIERS